MSTEDRADTIAAALIWMGGVALIALGWQVSDSLIAALIAAAVVGFFLILLLGPSTLVAVVAIVLSLAVDFIRPHRTRPDLPRRQPALAQEIVYCDHGRNFARPGLVAASRHQLRRLSTARASITEVAICTRP